MSYFEVAFDGASDESPLRGKEIWVYSSSASAVQRPNVRRITGSDDVRSSSSGDNGDNNDDDDAMSYLSSSTVDPYDGSSSLSSASDETSFHDYDDDDDDESMYFEDEIPDTAMPSPSPPTVDGIYVDHKCPPTNSCMPCACSVTCTPDDGTAGRLPTGGFDVPSGATLVSCEGTHTTTADDGIRNPATLLSKRHQYEQLIRAAWAA